MIWQEFKDKLTPREQDLVEFYKHVIHDFTLPAPQVLEIGSGWGLFSRSALESDNEAQITTIDSRVKLKSEFHENTIGFERRLKIITGDSKVEVLKLEFESYDFIFVDGDHGYVGTLTDARNAWGKLKVGGKMLFDDVFHDHNWKPNMIYASENPKEAPKIDFDYGVTNAFFEFIKEKGIYSFWGFNQGNGLTMIEKR